MSVAACIFCKIVQGEIPCRKVFEDDEMLAFHDINPMAPVHLLLIPREHIASMAELEEKHRSLVGKMMLVANRLAVEQGSPEGFRLIVNTGKIGRQDVYHLHMHVIGGASPLPGMITKS